MLKDIRRIVTGRWQENCFIVSDDDLNSAIIDPGDSGDVIVQSINQANLKVLAILNTHAHYDHVGAVDHVRNTFQALFYLHYNDFRLLQHVNLYRKSFNGEEVIPVPNVDYLFSELESALHLWMNIYPGHGKTATSKIELKGNREF